MNNKIKCYKGHFLFLMILLCSLSVVSQTTIRGQVIDNSTQESIEFANVIVTGQSLEYPIGTVTNSDGSFELSAEKGLYVLKVFFVGQELFSKEVEIMDKSVDLGIIMVKNSLQLNEVTISAKRNLIERKIDRLVFNVENSSKASVGDALEVLSVTPGVRVQNDQITMIGKGNLQVMINEKIVQLSDEDLANYLKSIASEDIKNIEVITTPPAKYEASGNSGLINITLKQAKKDAWNAQLRSMYRQQTYANYGVAGSYNMNINRLSLATSLNYTQGIYYQEQDDYAYFPDGVWYTHSPFKSNYNRISGRMDLTYKITPKWSMGAQYLFNSTDFNVTDAPYTPVFGNGSNEIIRSLKSQGRADYTPNIHSLNYNNEISIDTLGRSIAINLDYFSFNNPDTKTYNGISRIQTPFSQRYFRGRNTNTQDVTNVSAKLDVEFPLKWVDLDFGGKITSSNSENNIIFFNSGLVDTPITSFTTAENNFIYNENIQALYFSASKDFKSKWSTQIGLRMEATQTESKTVGSKAFGENNYTRFFPTLYFSYKASDSSSYSFNYSRRIQRPNFFELNPNIYFVNPFQTIGGNPFLQPALIDNFELAHTYKNLVTKVYYSHEDNLFSQVPLAEVTTNIIRFTYENFITTNRIGISENYTFDKVKWWSSSYGFDINYTKSFFYLSEDQKDMKGINASISTYNNFNLNQKKTLLAGLNYWYSFPGVNGIYDTKSASSFSISFQYLLLDNNLNISLRGNDLFKTSAERNVSRVNGVLQTARYYYDSRSIQLSISYKFGNTTLRTKKHQTGNRDERSRTGN